jgi:small subunit ribosomal protein S17
MSKKRRAPRRESHIGEVIAANRDRTATVRVRHQRPHPKYGKILHLSTKYHTHDPENTARIGDRVEIAACRPISKQKSFRLVRVIESARDRASTREAAAERAAGAGQEVSP